MQVETGSRARNARYRAKHFEKVKASREAWALANPDKVKASNKKYYERTKAERREYAKAWMRDQGPSYAYGQHLLRRYGIDFLTYSALLIVQCGRCSCCNEPLSSKERDVHLDHDHVDNKVRGILCHSCNATLGHARDSSKRLLQCVDYLKRFNV